MSSPNPIGNTPPNVPPNVPPTTPQVTTGSQQSSSKSNPPPATSWEDPTGAWQRFLSVNGTPATPREVEIFIATLMKFFSNVIIAQSNKAAKESSQRMKDAIEGRD
jgi:hypothetical protein